MNKNILIICVNYHNDNEVINLVREIFNQRGNFNQRVIIVDNSNRNISETPLVKLCDNKNILIYTSKVNLGYYGGAWWGMQQYLKEFPLPDWTIVCNADICFPDPDFFIKLIHYHSENPPSVVAPDIILIEPSGSLPSSPKHQNPHFINRPAKLRMHFYKWISRYYIIYVIFEVLSALRYKIVNTLRCRQEGAEIKYNKLMEIYAPFGAFVIFHRSYFESGGTLAHKCFLFGEEIFVAETVRKLKLNVIYDPRLKVIHKEHSSINLLKLKQKFVYIREASAYCANTFFRWNN